MSDMLCAACSQLCSSIGYRYDGTWEDAKTTCVRDMLACPEGCGEKFLAANSDYVQRNADGTLTWLPRP